MSVETKVKKIIANKLSSIDEDDIVPEASFKNDLGADSLTVVELIMAMEDAFEIDIDDEEAEKIVTVKDVIEYIKERT